MKNFWNIVKASVFVVGATLAISGLFLLMGDTFASRKLERRIFLFTSPSDFLAAICAVFCGVVAAVAIYVAFKQANDLHREAIAQSAKERGCEQKLRELDSISACVTSFISESIVANTITNFVTVPKSPEEVDSQHLTILNLYCRIESLYTELFLSGVLYDYCTDCDEHCSLCPEEKDITEKQREFAIFFRKLYHKLHDFIDFYQMRLVDVYFFEGIPIWELQREFMSEVAQNGGVCLPEDDNRPKWIGLSDRITAISNNQMQAESERAKFLEEITNLAVKTRDSFALYKEAVKHFELKSLSDPSCELATCKINRLEEYKKHCSAENFDQGKIKR